MLTGKRLFEGETVSDTLAQVLTKEPDWEQVPAKVRRLLQTCLEKDPKKRLRDIGDAWELLEEPRATAPSRSRLGWIAAAALAARRSVGLAGWWRATRPVEQPLKPLVRLDVDLGSDVSLGSLVRSGCRLFRPTARASCMFRKIAFSPAVSISPRLPS